METTQQIILIILSFCVWIIGGITILMSVLWITAQVVTHYWGKSKMMFLRFICYLTFNEKSQNGKNYYYNKQLHFMWDEVKRQVEKSKLDLVIANKHNSIFSEKELITLLEDAIAENAKLARLLIVSGNENNQLKAEIKDLKDEDEDEDY